VIVAAAAAVAVAVVHLQTVNGKVRKRSVLTGSGNGWEKTLHHWQKVIQVSRCKACGHGMDWDLMLQIQQLGWIWRVGRGEG
jgi:hypothetical protein